MQRRLKADDLYLTYSNPLESGDKYIFNRRSTFQERSVPCRIESDQSPNRHTTVLPFPKVPLPSDFNEDVNRNDDLDEYRDDDVQNKNTMFGTRNPFRTPRPPHMPPRYRRRLNSEVSCVGQASAAQPSPAMVSQESDKDIVYSSAGPDLAKRPNQTSPKRRRCGGVSSCNSNGNNSAVDRRQMFSTAADHTGQSIPVINECNTPVGAIYPHVWPYQIGVSDNECPPKATEEYEPIHSQPEHLPEIQDIIYTKDQLDIALRHGIHLPWMPVPYSDSDGWLPLSHPEALALHSKHIRSQDCMVPMEKKNILMDSYDSYGPELDRTQTATLLRDTGRDLRNSFLERTHETMEAAVCHSIRDRKLYDDIVRMNDSSYSRLPSQPYGTSKLDEEIQRYLDRSASYMDMLDNNANAQGRPGTSVPMCIASRRMDTFRRPEMLMTPIPVQPVYVSNYQTHESMVTCYENNYSGDVYNDMRQAAEPFYDGRSRYYRNFM